MTLWAKVLTVIVFILSLVFAGMSAVVYAKRQAYRAMYEQEKTQHAADKAADAEKIKTKDGQISDLTAAVTTKTAELAQTNLELQTSRRDADTLKASLAQTRLDLDAEKAQVTIVATNNADLTKRNAEYVKINGDLQTENKDLIAKLSAEQDLSRQLQASVKELQQTRDSLQAQLTQAKDTIGLNEEVFAELSKRNIEARPIIAGLQNVPAIDGRVLAVMEDTRTVVLNVGAKQGVRKNIDFTIFRGADFIAKVNVYDVQDKRCAATIITSTGPVKVNDEAQTRLHF